MGYLSAQLLGSLQISPGVWTVLHSVFFWLHFLLVTALLYYLPFSRLFHAIASPIVVAYNTLADQESHRVPSPAVGRTPSPAG